MAIKPLSTPDSSATFVSLDNYDPLLNVISISHILDRNNILHSGNGGHIFIFYLIQPIESENMMNVPDYSVEVIIAAFQICKCEERPP